MLWHAIYYKSTVGLCSSSILWSGPGIFRLRWTEVSYYPKRRRWCKKFYFTQFERTSCTARGHEGRWLSYKHRGVLVHNFKTRGHTILNLYPGNPFNSVLSSREYYPNHRNILLFCLSQTRGKETVGRTRVSSPVSSYVTLPSVKFCSLLQSFTLDGTETWRIGGRNTLNLQKTKSVGHTPQNNTVVVVEWTPIRLIGYNPSLQ